MTDSATGAAENAASSNEPYDATRKQKSLDKTARIPIKIVPAEKIGRAHV